MTQYSRNAQETESSSLDTATRLANLTDQHWKRSKSEELAAKEDIVLNDDHWAVINFLREHYLTYGLPRNARDLAKDLNQHFFNQGGSKFLYRLFPGGPITQGSRFAKLPAPANATDISFGSSY
jgi:tRNA 2-thiouridine synthesizing protein E